MMEWTLWCWAEPEVPIEAFGDGLCVFRALDRLCPEWPTGPVDHLAHRSDGSAPNPFAQQASILGCLVGNRNLCGHPGLASDFGDALGLIDRVSQRFLAEDVFFLLHR